MEQNVQVIFLFCPPKIAALSNFRLLMTDLSPRLSMSNTLLLGDCNVNINYDRSLVELMQTYGFKQCINCNTTHYGTLIDHVYTNLDYSALKCGVLDSYFSDHRPIFAGIALNKCNK